MSYKVINDQRALVAFSDALDSYQDKCVFNQMDTVKKRTAALLLKGALERIVFAYPIDSFRMLTILSERLINNSAGAYGPNMLLSLASVITPQSASRLILNIPYAMHKAKLGEFPPFDQTWFSMMNGNPSIQIFLENLPTSSLMSCGLSAAKEIFLDPVKMNDKDECVNLTISDNPLDVTLDGYSFSEINILPTLNDEQVIKSYIEVSCNMGSFGISSNILIDSGIKEFFNSVIGLANLTDGYLKKFNIPRAFCKYKLYIISLDGGVTWRIYSFEINHPSSTN